MWRYRGGKACAQDRKHIQHHIPIKHIQHHIPIKSISSITSTRIPSPIKSSNSFPQHTHTHTHTHTDTRTDKHLEELDGRTLAGQEWEEVIHAQVHRVRNPSLRQRLLLRPPTSVSGTTAIPLPPHSHASAARIRRRDNGCMLHAYILEPSALSLLPPLPSHPLPGKSSTIPLTPP
jgi:hypothetical protein